MSRRSNRWLISAMVLSLGAACTAQEAATSAPPPAAGETPTEDASPQAQAATRLHARDLLDSPLRGAVVETSWLGTSEPPWDGQYYPTADSFQSLRDLGANVVVLYAQHLWTLEPPYEPVEEEFALFDEALDTAAQVEGLPVIVGIRNGPGRNEMMPDYEEGGALPDIYKDPAAQEAYIAMIQDVVRRYVDRPEIIAWEPMIEPTPHTYFGEESITDDEAVPRFPDGMAWWNDLAARLIEAIREVDPNRPILLEPVFWGNAEGFIGWEAFEDDNIIYSLHTYEPYEYTHQIEPPYLEYPYESEMEEATVDAGWLDDYLTPVDDFQAEYDVPIIVGEWGGMRWLPGVEDYYADQIALFEDRGWSWTFYAWADEVWDHSGLEAALGPDPENVEPDFSNPVFAPVAEGWQANTGE